MDTLYLIDGHALIFKMYYAFLRRPMINSKGQDTSILYGFTKYLLELVEREQPTHLAVAFDPPGGTFRRDMYPAYKATRQVTPQLVIDALEPLTELVQAMNIPVVMVPGYEADDVIGTLAVRGAAEGMDVAMVSPDKDYGQLIAPHVRQMKPGKGGSDAQWVDEAGLCALWGISHPRQVIDMLAICGDAADNVPGVKGVGEVGAAKLIARYGSVENIYAHLDELPPRQQALFAQAQPHMALSKDLVTIRTDVPLELSPGQTRLPDTYAPRLADLFDRYEFSSLRKYIAPHLAPQREEQSKQIFEVQTVPIETFVQQARRSHDIGLVTETHGEGVFARVERITAAATGPEDGAIPVACCFSPETLPQLQPLLEDPGIDKYGSDLKRQSHALAREGIALEGRWIDIQLLHYLVNPESSHDVALLARTYLDVRIDSASPDLPEMASLFDAAAPATDAAAPFREAAVLPRLGRALRQALGAQAPLYDDLEEPLAKVLARMERTGVRINPAPLAAYADTLRKELDERQARIRDLTGEPQLNISSPKQVGEVLFGKLGLDPKARKRSTKGQYSTDEATLLSIEDRHPVVREILEYRAVKKLLGTYIEPLPGCIDPRDGRIHTTFNQALTATGRLSSSNPNLQNIPIRTERGKEIRKAFVPGTPDGIMVSADYSQIELRIMAHLSCDEHLCDAFRQGMDIHAATASKIFGVDVASVSREQRGIAKTANFGIMYGISSFGLAQRLHTGRKAAQALIEDYFASFPAIRAFIGDSVTFARENGYVETLLGRRRYLPDINAHNATVRALAERNAVNAPIQGTAADIIKLAMIRVDQALREAGLQSKMVLQIHDELVFDARPDELPALQAIVREVMEQVLPLRVPLTVECNAGNNWLEAH